MTGGAPSAAPTDTQRADTQRADAIRARLAALEIQHLDLLADESVPGRKHRLDAVRAARRDLESEFAELAELAGDGVVAFPSSRAQAGERPPSAPGSGRGH